MLHYKHILLATDLDEHSHKTAKRAQMLAKQSKAKLSIVHVIDHTAFIYGSGEYSIPVEMSIEEELTQSAKDSLAKLANMIDIQPEDQHLLSGSPRAQIIELAQKLGTDLIVVGSHARHGAEILLGSTANAILHAAHCDVYAVNNR
jgi:universal stress protein A